MEKRTFDRVLANIDIRFFLGNAVHPATAINICEKGMCLITEIFLPCFSRLDFMLLSKHHVLKIPGMVKWIIPTEFNDKIGIEIIRPSAEYLEFLSGLRSKKDLVFH